MKTTSSTSSDQPPAGGSTVSFGFREVPQQAKAPLVRGVFDRVAERYDLMNDLMSGGMHRLWKDAFVDWVAPRPGEVICDVAGGTGDIARRLVKRSRQAADRRGGQPAKVVVIDINEAMINAGRKDPQGIDWVVGDAQKLPMADASVDGLTIAFGLRNVTDPQAALCEFRRVLRPGGRFACLEFSHPSHGLAQAAYDAFSFGLVPRIGKAVVGDAEPYQYLVESIRRFPKADQLVQMVQKAGFGRADVRLMAQGIVAMHTGWAV